MTATPETESKAQHPGGQGEPDDTRAFRPTRTCPHRLCSPLHAIALVATLIILTAFASIAPWIIAVTLVGGLFSIGIYRLVHKQTYTDTFLEEVEGSVTVAVRLNWARAAVASDALIAACALAVLAVSIVRPPEEWSAEGPSLPGIVTSVAWILLHQGLHRRAARVCPKRAA